MNKIISFFTAVIFSVMGFFGIPYDAPDLEATQKAPVALSREQEALFTDIFETETAYLASMQLSNGALPMTHAENGELRMEYQSGDGYHLTAEAYRLVLRYIVSQKAKGVS